MFSENSLTTN